jgi:hypothetical protein
MENENNRGTNKKKEDIREWRKEDTHNIAIRYFKYLTLWSV